MSLEPILFSTDDALLRALASTTDPMALPAAVVVDWENSDGKRVRQGGAAGAIGFDTSLGRDTVDDLARARARIALPVICRVDADGSRVDEEIAQAVALGADEVLLAMVRDPLEVERALALVEDRAGVGVMIETRDAITCVTQLAELPIARAYVGLVDLALERGSDSIFSALVDGTVDAVTSALGSVPFGVAGMTLPGGGSPVPSRLLLGELVRLGCSFSFLRRSFVRDLCGAPPGPAIAEIRRAARAMESRSAADVAADRAAFVTAVAQLEQSHG